MKHLQLAFLFLFSLCMHSQNTKRIDSLKSELQNRTQVDSITVALLSTLSEALMFSQPKEARSYALKEIETAKKIGFRKGIASGNMHLGNYYGNRNENDSALYYFNIAKKHFKEIKSTRGLIFINHSLSVIQESTGNLDEAIRITKETLKLIEEHEEDGDLKTKFIGAQHNALANRYIEKGNFKIALIEAFKALECFEAIQHKSRKADVIKQIGDIESGLENHDSSITYFNQAIEIYKNLGEKIYLAYTYNSLGISYQNLKNYEKAKASYNLAITFAKEVEDKSALTNAYNNLAGLEIINKNYSIAKQLLIEAQKIAEEENLQLSLASAYEGLSQVAYHLNTYAEALHKNNQAITLSKKNGTLPHLQGLYTFRSKILEALNQNKEAIFYLKASQKINDSLFSSNKTQQIEELKAIYETEKKEQQIKNQKKEIELLNVKGRVNNLQRLLLGFGLLLALIAVYAFYQRNKRNKMAKEQAELEVEFKTKELTTRALHLAKKNEVLNDLKEKAKVLKADANADPGYQMLIQTINFDLQDDNNWDNFSKYFEEVHKDFNSNAQQQFPNITSNDLRLMALIKMNLSSKEIANILNISSDGIKKSRQRLRKKMGIESNDSLEAIVIAI
ncbi:tetratricopeptide repeat protein [Cellulophaga sp. F20128]|uniref:tetratricopeptide repeat protein n=1 Tax=Cellulophaga sp. F20128 TaxID=2926413 RepID=UPI001FF3A008|nr:tetratricopeptide repeat protein [Cellulophaga sp. F20128]MCK0157564.1 tetratricopeptide repeat protein [Cellulophaga sp. F20128]